MRMRVGIKHVTPEQKSEVKNKTSFEIFILKGVVLGRYISKIGDRQKS